MAIARIFRIRRRNAQEVRRAVPSAPRAIYALGALVVGLATATLRAGEPSRFFIRHWETGDGLPQHSVISMTQTRDGYLWVGTLDGLARFDGVKFDKFYDANTPGLNSTRIIKLFEDSHTNFWIGTDNAGTVLVDRNGVIKRVDLGADTGAPLVSICEDGSGGIWLRLINSSVYAWRDGKATLLLRDAREVIVEGSNKLWVATSGISEPPKLLGIRFPQSGFQNVFAVEDEIPIGSTQLLMSSPRGGYWLIANGQVNNYQGNQVIAALGKLPAVDSIKAACEDHEGHLIIGTEAGVFWFAATGGGLQISSRGIFNFDANGTINDTPLDSSDLTHNTIQSLCMDREGSLWVGTDGGGLHRVTRQSFELLEAGRTVASVCGERHGGLWAASGGDVVFIRERTRKIVKMKPEQIDLLKARWSTSVVYEDTTGRVWAGAFFLEIEGGNNRRMLIPPLFVVENDALEPVRDARLNGSVLAIYEDRNRRLWVGAKGGLACRDKGQWKFFTTRDGLSANSVHAIADDSEGNIWVGTEGGGLNRFRDGHFAVIRQADGLPGDYVSALYADADGALWAGTTGGLGRFFRGKWTRYSKAEGLLNEHVGYILEDNQHFLWLGSTAGLMRARKQELNAFADGRSKDIFFRNYGRADGLPSAECRLESQPAACLTEDGKAWFSTIRGLAGADPATLRINTNPPPVVIESVLIDGVAQNPSRLRGPSPTSIAVPASKESLEIHFTSLNLSAPLQGKFKYRMEGYEKTWTEKPGDVRFARYPKLPPDKYKFQVKAFNEDNVESQNVATLAVEVLPPFWQTWWFRMLVALAAVGLVVGIVHYLSTQRLQGQLAALRQQEALERERARIARDLHDQLGANLTQVALLGELAETDKDSPDEVEAHARQISLTARETTHALDEIVWTVNPSNDTLDGLINYVCKYAQEYLALAGLKYRLDVPSQLPNTPISPDLRHNVFLAAKETINNIVKHSGATSAWLRMHLEPHRFVLEIEDDGKGLSPDAESKGRSGLKNMRKRMEDIGGEFEIGPRAGGGTVVKLKSPNDESRI